MVDIYLGIHEYVRDDWDGRVLAIRVAYTQLTDQEGVEPVLGVGGGIALGDTPRLHHDLAGGDGEGVTTSWNMEQDGFDDDV